MTSREVRQIAHKNRRKKLVISYFSKTRNKQTIRTIRPYEVEGGVLWASDTVHGTNTIHKFFVRNITTITPTVNGFRPIWPIKLAR